mmetsp:Transcript_52888/g.61766  ORF Transcript_52888/g.61766 Transcript_52888/m.61766 type:complete len:420 (+) Transcript_52888:130-1389(+)
MKLSLILLLFCSSSVLHPTVSEDGECKEKKDDDKYSVVPFSYSLHRQSTYHAPIRYFSISSGVLEGWTFEIEQRFREDGSGLGSAQWDGSFVLGEVLQRLDFGCGLRNCGDESSRFSIHSALDDLVAEVLEFVTESEHESLPRPWLRLDGPRLWLPSLESLRHEKARARKIARTEYLQKYSTKTRRASSDNNKGATKKSKQNPPQVLKNMHTIELGSGLGLVSLMTCLLGAQSIATDGDDAVLKHAQVNFARNIHRSDKINNLKAGSESNTTIDLNWLHCITEETPNDSETEIYKSGKVASAVLWWGDTVRAKELRNAVGDINSPPTLVLAADVVYGYDKDSGDRFETFDSLIQSLIDLSGPDTIIVLAYKPRRPSESYFFEKLWNTFEGAALQRNLLHSDFHSADMDIFVLRLRKEDS